MRIAIKAMLIMYIVYTIIALFEISTGFHFKMSAINFRPSYVRFTPTVFYTNPNDFSAIFTMMFIFLMNFYISREKKKNNYLLILISLLHLFILIKTSSRLNLIVFIFYLIVIWPKFFIKFSFFSLFVILISHDFIKHKIGIYDSTIFEYFTNIFNFNLSNSGRFHLYKSSFLSLKQNFGLGWGINASHFFYESLNIEKLGNLVNPHSNLLEILINSGVIVFLLYIFIIVLLINKFLKLKDYKNVFQVLFYQIILFSSSSSLFLWPSYLFFILYIGLSLGNNNSIKYI
ncbi:O-antigen ligase family protein [bacterium]|nr:O-antigen ligase family protein [bacterium]